MTGNPASTMKNPNGSDMHVKTGSKMKRKHIVIFLIFHINNSDSVSY